MCVVSSNIHKLVLFYFISPPNNFSLLIHPLFILQNMAKEKQFTVKDYSLKYISDMIQLSLIFLKNLSLIHLFA